MYTRNLPKYMFARNGVSVRLWDCGLPNRNPYADASPVSVLVVVWGLWSSQTSADNRTLALPVALSKAKAENAKTFT